MTEISKKFESLIRSTQKKMLSNGYLMPVKTIDGIMIGRVLLSNRGTLKDISVGEKILFENINLNAVAIYIANAVALEKNHSDLQKLYKIDQDYGKWFQDAQHLYHMYQKAVENKNNDKIDIFLARYQDAKCRAKLAKDKALSLCPDAINKT
jgi:hypothetical protein